MLRQNIDMQPRNALFESDVAREAVAERLDLAACLLGRHARNGEVARLAEDVRGEVRRGFRTDQIAHVATHSVLVCAVIVVVAIHRTLEDIATNYKQRV